MSHASHRSYTDRNCRQEANYSFDPSDCLSLPAGRMCLSVSVYLTGPSFT